MKNFLILFLLFSLCLLMQASASVCGNSYLAYQKKKIGKKAIKRILKEKMKPKGEVPVISWCEMFWITLLFILIGGGLGLISWLVFKGVWLFWVVMGGITGFVIALSLFIPIIFYKP